MCASQEAAFATLAAQPSWQQSAPKPIRHGQRTATVTRVPVPYLGVLAAVLAAAEMCTSQRGRRQSEAKLLAVLLIAWLGAVLLRTLYNRVLRGANCDRRRRRNLTSGTGQHTNKQTLWPKPERVSLRLRLYGRSRCGATVPRRGRPAGLAIQTSFASMRERNSTASAPSSA
jgi:hypothetical protein